MLLSRKTRPIGIATLGKVAEPTVIANTKSIDFDGTNDYMDLEVDLEDWLETPQKTFSCWIKNNNNTDEGRVFNVGYNDTGRATGFAFGLDAGTNNKPFVFLRDTSAGAVKVEFGDVCDTSSWYHFAIVQDGANDKAYCYQNGVLKATFHSTEDAPFNHDIGEISQATNESAKIGRHWHLSDSQYFAGNIDEVAIWDRVLKASEITKIYKHKSINLAKSSAGYSSNNLVAWWRMGDGDSYDTVADRRKTFFTGSSIHFDGTNNFAIIEDHADFEFGDASNDSVFSVSAWIHMNDATRFRIIGKTGFDGSNKMEWLFTTDADDDLRLILYDATTANLISQKTDAALVAGQWYHVAATYNANEANTGIILYVNGSAVASTGTDTGSYTAMHSSAANVMIGQAKYSTSTTGYADGKITDVAIWNVVLSAADVTSIYNSGEPNNLKLAASYDTDRTSNLKGYWRLGLEGEGDTLPDWGGLVENNANVGLIMNQAQPITTWGSNIISFNYHNDDITASFISSANNGSGGITGNGTEYIMEMIGGSYQYMRINERDVSGTALDINGKMLKITMSIKCDSDFLGSDFEIDAARSEITNTLLFKPTTSYTTITFYQLANQNYINSFTMRSEGIVYMKDIAIYIADGAGHCLPSNTNDEIDYEEHAPNRLSGTMTNMTSGDIETAVPI